MEFPGNSHISKEAAATTPKPPVTRVVSGKVVRRKTPISHRFKALIFEGDAKEVGSYIISDVLIPALKNLIVDAGEQGLRRAVYRTNTRPGIMRGAFQNAQAKVTYNSPVQRSQPVMLPGQPPYSAPRMQSSTQILLETNEDAEIVLDMMVDKVDKYQVVSVSDLNELVGLPTSPIDNKWGWTDLRTAAIRQSRDGFILDLPAPESI